jgi:broad specificity phosphatase PhoE
VARCLFVSHPEVVVEPDVPVTDWGLSAPGRARAEAFARTLSAVEWRRVVSSAETKARETAAVVASALGLPSIVDEALGENDRSATGFLPPEEFERTADRFFAEPDRSVRGWETATAARARIVAAVRRLAGEAPETPTVFVSHGAVGSLLVGDLLGEPVSRELDQPRQGCCFAFDPVLWRAEDRWRPLEDA